MNKYLKNITRDNKNHPNSINDYLESEIDAILSKKISQYQFSDSYGDNKYSKKKTFHKVPSEESNNYDDNYSYSSHINYNLQDEQPFKATKYIDEESDTDFLPFDEEEIQPRVHDQDQLKAMIKRLLKRAIHQWLDDNLEIIIEKTIRKNYDKYILRPKRKPRYYE